MRVLVAGATGVIGSPLVPLLEAVGHDVVALAGSRRRSEDDAVAVVRDRDALVRAVASAAPDAVVNLLTPVPAVLGPRRAARHRAAGGLPRTGCARDLYEAAREAGARRIIAQGLAYAYQPGEGLADEDAPLWTEHTPRRFAPVLAALLDLERATADAGGLVLRFGHLYGPGSAFAARGSFTERVRAGRVPVVGGGRSVLSFTHADDAATAIVAALDKEVGGVLNVVDDTPLTMAEFLPAFARMLDAPQPRRTPVALARLAVGGWGVACMTGLRGADNARARSRLRWRPRHPSWPGGRAPATRAR
ncbi:NAD-dependent epimerase/dehydratase family protein [Actinomadura litoris]|uniref:NAD-dependent epimerase/dehydratase family protein n=1 Tax=Actinomadura litoris TaxID=2678616 RepID=A0A7K1LEF8_9ACTN|nr:NAD(P)-dependent oxidoreductase [Actinomadura litoris]MUN42802.1 NAD-dependent epimerase/dehydratase family protein [Actinomadura litoris]